MNTHTELPIIQRTYDLIKWFVPVVNKLPRDFKFVLGDRIQNTLYGLLDGLIRARYRREKLEMLESLNAELDVLRYQTRLCRDFDLVSVKRYEYASGLMNEIGENQGGWIRKQKGRLKKEEAG
jgi:hypothetical protein